MCSRTYLRRLVSSDEAAVRIIYEDAVLHQARTLYSLEQIQAWSALAYLPGILDQPLADGEGWVSCVKDQVVAFAVRYPSNRLALLYSRSDFSRQGHGKSLVSKIESDACDNNEDKVVTEASLLSYNLLLNCGWYVVSPELITIGGIRFKRFVMEKSLLK